MYRFLSRFAFIILIRSLIVGLGYASEFVVLFLGTKYYLPATVKSVGITLDTIGLKLMIINITLHHVFKVNSNRNVSKYNFVTPNRIRPFRKIQHPSIKMADLPDGKLYLWWHYDYSIYSKVISNRIMQFFSCFQFFLKVSFLLPCKVCKVLFHHLCI